jgi:hypothetical protein
MTLAIATSLLDQVVSVYASRWERESGNRPEYHLITGWVRAVAFDEHGHSTLLVESIHSGYSYSFNEAKPGDLVTISSKQIEGTLRLSRTNHPFEATQAPGFPKPPAPTVECDRENVDQTP